MNCQDLIPTPPIAPKDLIKQIKHEVEREPWDSYNFERDYMIMPYATTRCRGGNINPESVHPLPPPLPCHQGTRPNTIGTTAELYDNAVSSHSCNRPKTWNNIEDIIHSLPAQVSTLTMSELSSLLKTLQLPEVANVCEEHLIDGNIFKDITEQDFKEEPFKLKGLPLIKVWNIVKNNWRPKL